MQPGRDGLMSTQDIIDYTPAEALKILLATRLRFGDVKHINALAALSAAEDLIITRRLCPACDGTGGIECDACRVASRPRICDECDECDGSGRSEWTREEVYEMAYSWIMDLLRRAAEKQAKST